MTRLGCNIYFPKKEDRGFTPEPKYLYCPFDSAFLIRDPTNHDHVFCPSCGYSLGLPIKQAVTVPKKNGGKKKRNGR